MTEKGQEHELKTEHVHGLKTEQVHEIKNELKTERIEDDRDTREIKRRRIETSHLHDTGIQRTISGSSFTAIIKQRYSDFIVNEIIRDSETKEVQVVRITDLDSKEKDNVNISAEEFVGRLVGTGMTSELAVEIGDLGQKTDKVVCTPETVEDRDVRTAIHAACHDFGIDSKTLLPDNTIEFRHAKQLAIDWKKRIFSLAQ
jgi:hypothetical protein